MSEPSAQPAISKGLYRFFASWYAWATTTATEGSPYSRHSSLCYSVSSHQREELQALLRLHFYADPIYPFGGARVFDIESLEGANHLNTARVAFVRERLLENERFHAGHKEPQS